MRVLVTRPEPDAQATAAKLGALGCEAVVAPLSRIVFGDPPTISHSPGALVVTSRNGVRALARWPRAREWRGLPLYAVGDATADLARESGFMDVRSASGDLVTLRRLIAAETAPEVQILQVAARERSGNLKSADLAAHAVTTVEAYRAEETDLSAAALRAVLGSDPFEAVLVYSRRAAMAVAGLATDPAFDTMFGRAVFCAISDRAAEPLGSAGFPPSRIRVAAAPDEASLLALI